MSPTLAPSPVPRLYKALSPKESAIVRAIRAGCNTAYEVAVAIQTKESTARQHIRNMCSKIEGTGPAMMVVTRYALESRIASKTRPA